MILNEELLHVKNPAALRSCRKGGMRRHDAEDQRPAALC
jgi:hypothetical protein